VKKAGEKGAAMITLGFLGMGFIKLP
jgi:hypothetical protein